MSNMSMNNLNIQRRVLNSMYNQSMPIFSNHCSVPLPPNHNQERNPESKINLAFGLLRKNTARTNGIWKIIQSLINRMKKVEEMAIRIDQVIKRNEELEDKRRKNNKKRNEKKRIKREKKQEEKQMKRKEQLEQKGKEKEIKSENDNKSERKNQINLGPQGKREERKKKEEEKKFDDSRIPKNDFLEISRTKFDSRKNKIDSMDNLEISRTNLINKKIINKKINKINKDEISFGDKQLMDNLNEDECSLQLKDKMNLSNENLSRNGRNKQNVINLVNRFIFNNKNIDNNNQKWVSQTFIPLIEDIMDLNLYEINVSEYVRKVRSPPEFRKKFWQWWKKKEDIDQMPEIRRIIQNLKQSKDPDIIKLISSN